MNKSVESTALAIGVQYGATGPRGYRLGTPEGLELEMAVEGLAMIACEALGTVRDLYEAAGDNPDCAEAVFWRHVQSLVRQEVHKREAGRRFDVIEPAVV